MSGYPSVKHVFFLFWFPFEPPTKKRTQKARALGVTAACFDSTEEDGDFAASSDRVRRLSFGGSELRRMARLWAALDAVHRLNCQAKGGGEPQVA